MPVGGRDRLSAGDRGLPSRDGVRGGAGQGCGGVGGRCGQNGRIQEGDCREDVEVGPEVDGQESGVLA